MRGVVTKTILAAVLAGSSLLVATGANAHDRWDKWDRWEHKHHWKHSRGYGPPERVIVERPVYVAQPVRPVYVWRRWRPWCRWPRPTVTVVAATTRIRA